MKSSQVIPALRALLSGDRDEGVRLIRLIECTERAAGRGHVSRELELLVDRAPALIKLPNAPNQLNVVQPTRTLESLLLADSTRCEVLAFLDEWQFREAIQQIGIRPRSTLLFSGPSGNGKTALAEAIAAHLSLPLAYLDYSQVIESHLGDTGKNVGKAMKFAQQMPLVLFLDECDSLVGQRTGGAASGCEKEENRAVNQVLLELDALAGRSIVIFATNLPDSLDPALVRRIAIRLELPSPTAKQRARFVRQLRSQWTFLDEAQLIEAAKDKHSFAEIEQVVHDAVRRTVVEAERQRLQKCSA